MRFYNAAGELDGLALARTYEAEVAVVRSALDGVVDGNQAGPTGLTPARTYGEEVAVVLAALDRALAGQKGVYVSGEVTTGRRLFELLKLHRVPDVERLQALLGMEEYRRQLLEHNRRSASEFARSVKRRFNGARAVVNPAPFEAPGWDQRQYLAFWETVIRGRCDEVFFNRYWQYSNGCTFELAVAVDSRLPTRDDAGSVLDLERGIELVGAAVREWEAADLPDAGLRLGLERLLRLRGAAVPFPPRIA